MTVSAEVPPAAEAESAPPRPRPALEALIKTGGVVVSLLATLLTATLELFMTQLRVGGIPIGVSVLLALVANYAICWFAVGTVGRLRAVAPPWALWTAIMFYAAGTKTAEGDRLLAGDDYVGLVTILAGSITFAVYVYRRILSRVPTVTKL